MLLEVLTLYDRFPNESIILESDNSKDVWIEANSIARYERRKYNGTSIIYRLNRNYKRVESLAHV